jgi:urea transporter
MKSATVIARALVFGAIATGSVAVVGSIIGFLVAGLPGLVSALIGASATALFMGFTALSILLAARVTRRRPSPTVYFSIVLGMMLLKFAAFIAILVVLRGQAWMNPYVFSFTLIAAVIGSLIADAVALKGARVPYVGDIDLPGAPAPSPAPADHER